MADWGQTVRAQPIQNPTIRVKDAEAGRMRARISSDRSHHDYATECWADKFGAELLGSYPVMLSESGGFRCFNDLICLNRPPLDFRAIHQLIEDSQNFRSRIDATKLVSHRGGAGPVTRRLEHSSYRLA
jgi:hypothetical protein